MANSSQETGSEQAAEEATEKTTTQDISRSSNETAEAADTPQKSGFKNHLTRWKAGYWSHKRWSLPASVLVILLVLLAVPASRYKLLGLFLKETVQVSVVDSTTATPVSGAQIQVGGQTATTSAKGRGSLTLPVGNTLVVVTKQYYKSASDKVLVSYSTSHNSVTVHLVATGRQVPIMVVNRITGKPVADAELKVLNTEAKTDKSGKAIIVLPVSMATQAGTITANNFNATSVKVQVTTQTVAANTYALTPSGSIYFLSNLSGNVDVVKTNLDGTDRKTVLAGTGNEDPRNTVLLASRDWKYLALLAQRKTTGTPELDLIDTSTDTMSNMDEGSATFTLVGWDGDRFIYQVNRNSVQSWQSGQQVLKSFNAATKAITTLAQTTASGDSSTNYLGQQFGTTSIVNGRIIYSLNWNQSYYYNQGQLSSKQATLNTVNADGSNNAVVKGFSLTPGTQTTQLTIDIEPYKGPNALAIQFANGLSDSFYEYQNGQVTTLSGITDQNFYANNYPTYLLSPSGNQTFWSTPTDGKNALFVGDSNGNNDNKIASLSDYSPYGWYTDNYLLVSKNSSELYTMPAGGGTPTRISDYFKPSQFFSGYGGGYGGI